MKLFILSILAFLLSTNIYSQKDTCACLVYKTSDNYKNNISAKGEKIDWGIRFTWQGTEEVLRLITTDSIVKYKAGTAFAYIDTDCSLYCFYKEDIFIKVLNQDNICLYTRRATAYYKAMAMSNTTNYFSKNLFSPIYKLTKKNLMKVYKDNTPFIEAIKKTKNDDALIKKSADTEQYNTRCAFRKKIKIKVVH